MTTTPRSLAVLLALVVAACTGPAVPTTSVPPGATSTPGGQPTGTPTLGPTDTPTPSQTQPSTPPTVTPSPVPTGSSGTLADRLAGPLAQMLEQRRTSLGIPGMSATIIFPDDSMWSSASGMADVDLGEVATADTPFVVGSITKTFVSAAIMQLVDEGKLSLDDPLANWLPDYPKAAQITLRMLLGHTSGIFNLYESPDYSRVLTNPHKTWTPQDVLDKLAGPPYCDPGECYHYSNTGFILLGLVIEAQTGNSFGQVIRQRFLTPLGLDATYFQGDGPPPANTARGYRESQGSTVAIDDGSGYRPTQSEGTVIWAAGGIVASAPDIAHWGRALYGGSVVSADALAQMTDFVFEPGNEGGYYGLGTRMRKFDGISMEGHTGTLRAFNAAMWYLPSLDLTVVVMTNHTAIDANAITDAFLSVAVPAIP